MRLKVLGIITIYQVQTDYNIKIVIDKFYVHLFEFRQDI